MYAWFVPLARLTGTVMMPLISTPAAMVFFATRIRRCLVTLVLIAQLEKLT
jgi:hypothetical protein